MTDSATVILDEVITIEFDKVVKICDLGKTVKHETEKAKARVRIRVEVNMDEDNTFDIQTIEGESREKRSFLWINYDNQKWESKKQQIVKEWQMVLHARSIISLSKIIKFCPDMFTVTRPGHILTSQPTREPENQNDQRKNGGRERRQGDGRREHDLGIARCDSEIGRVDVGVFHEQERAQHVFEKLAPRDPDRQGKRSAEAGRGRRGSFLRRRTPGVCALTQSISGRY
jgi:hypothetical protein